MRAKYCKCKNTYTIHECSYECSSESYWKQGIGSISQNLYADITLVGSRVVKIQANQNYIDLGATSNDSVDGDLTSSIVVSSNVDTSVLGSYTVTYSVTNSRGRISTKSRTVIVEYTQIPIISLVGSSSISINYSDIYTDLGATGVSSYYGNISNRIIVDNPVNTSVVSSYLIRYNLIDQSGNQAEQVTRTVNVIYTEIPVITLLGDSIVEVTQGDSYIDAGVSATSSYYGNITNQVITNNLVNTSNLGYYQVLYNVTDESGNQAVQVTRTVNIIPHQSYWMSLATGYSQEPVLHATIASGEVYLYTYEDEQGNETNLYRFIRTDLTLDAFYSGFDGTNLSGFITQKQINL